MSELLLALGLATSYSPGVMAEVVENRVAWGQLPAETDPARCVALLDCSRLGDSVWLQVGDQVREVTVCDCACTAHRERLQKRGWAVDLSYPLAQELGLPQNWARVWSGPPRPGGTQPL